MKKKSNNYPLKIDVAYHAGCLDGRAAMFAIEKEFENVADIKGYPCAYSHSVPHFREGARVYIVDFAFPLDDMVEIMENHKTVWVDHHATSAQKCASLLNRPGVLHDVKYSGAMLTYMYLNGLRPGFDAEEQCPWLYRYVSDRDLWKFSYENTPYVVAYLQSLDSSFETWNACYDVSLQGSSHEEPEDGRALVVGEALVNMQKKYTERIASTARPIIIEGVPVISANTGVQESDVCHALLMAHPEYKVAAAYYTAKGGGTKFSLRSVAPVDCSKLAAKFGGGGHPQAAGFFVNDPSLAITHVNAPGEEHMSSWTSTPGEEQ